MPVAMQDIAAERVAEIKLRRDRKLALVLQDTRPAWITSEQISLVKNNCLFEVVFRYGGRWVRRRYDYDAEVDVLHFAGETPFDETGLHTLSDDLLFSPPT